MARPRARRFHLLGAAVALSTALLMPAGAAHAQESAPIPGGPDLSPGPCPDSPYPECRRLRFSFPVHVTPGANYQLVAPSIGKPTEDGYMTRMNANLVRADGSVPPVDILHLHHAVWASVPRYGNFLPFFGVGEEKTILYSPGGFGMRVRPTDVWALNFMIHNLITTPETVYITWEVDFVPKAAAERQGLVPVRPVWIDVRYEDQPLYPVFNVQRPFGRLNPATGRRECTYPRDRCAAFDPYGREQPGNGTGYDWRVTDEYRGTLVGLAGHVHPGGLRDEVSLVREIEGEEVERPIFTSEAVYFDGGDPVSWDFAMTATRRDWRVKIEPGDRIRLNTVYDAERGNWYEGMGIVMGWLAPPGTEGTDPFRRVRVRVRARSRSGRRPRYRYVSRYVRFSTRGDVTHGHLPENDNHGGDLARPLPDKEGPLISENAIGAFRYQEGDLSSVDDTGIPRVRVDGTLTFRNFDAFTGIWHTITPCAPPCTGVTGVSYPVADGPPLDSLELGWVPPPTDTTQAAGQNASYTIQPRRDGLEVGETVTYFCRVHPFMRGAFKVVE